jgi:glycosyltransferase involved in cell wall biosynthesis
MTPRLAVVTACYNHGQYIVECMESVLSQSEQDIEHIIIDDGSTDDSAYVAYGMAGADMRIQIRRNTANRGLAYSLNRGIAMARAPWVLKVDADDTIDSRYVEEILRAADDDPSRNIIFSPAQHFGSRTDVYTYPSFEPRQLTHTLMIAGCAAMKRELWDAVGGYDETMRYAEDWDLHIRAQLAVGLVRPISCRTRCGPTASTARARARRASRRYRSLRKYWKGHTKRTSARERGARGVLNVRAAVLA